MTDAVPEALTALNPDDLCSVIHDAGFQVLWTYVQDPSGWLFYPSRFGQIHPRLNGRDALGQYIEAAHKRGLRFMGYYVPFEMGAESRRHPEWRAEFIGDTVPSSPPLWGNLCYNRPGAWTFFLNMLDESVRNYPMDAVFIDNFWQRHCGCAYCQKRYHDETGSELPRLLPEGPSGYLDFRDPRRPEVSAYHAHTASWVLKWAADMRRTVKAARSDCLIEMQFGISVFGSGSRQMYTRPPPPRQGLHEFS
jgi:uncharacterized lipoprotein YddW (UPF0748 family)